MALREVLVDLYSRFDSTQMQARYAAAAKAITDEEKKRVRRVGDRIPVFSVKDPLFGTISSSQLLQRGPLVLNFYRGLWCSYCQLDLLDLEQTLPDIRKANGSVV